MSLEDLPHFIPFKSRTIVRNSHLFLLFTDQVELPWELLIGKLYDWSDYVVPRNCFWLDYHHFPWSRRRVPGSMEVRTYWFVLLWNSNSTYSSHNVLMIYFLQVFCWRLMWLLKCEMLSVIWCVNFCACSLMFDECQLS